MDCHLIFGKPFLSLMFFYFLFFTIILTFAVGPNLSPREKQVWHFQRAVKPACGFKPYIISLLIWSLFLWDAFSDISFLPQSDCLWCCQWYIAIVLMQFLFFVHKCMICPLWLKGVVHPKMKIVSSFNHFHIASNCLSKILTFSSTQNKKLWNLCCLFLPCNCNECGCKSTLKQVS